MLSPDHTHAEGETRFVNKSQRGTYLLVVPWDVNQPGGVNQVVINLYREIERGGSLKPLILVLDWHARSPKAEVIAGFDTIRMRVREPVSSTGAVYSLARYLLALPQTVFSLRAFIGRFNVRVVNAHFPTLAILGFVILKQLRFFSGPLLLSFHGADIRTAQNSTALTKFFWRRIIQRADAIVACSDSLVDEIRTFVPRLARPLVTVHNGVHSRAVLQQELEGSEISQPPPQRRYILNVASYEYKKGQDVLIKAFARVARNVPDVDLVIIGGDGPAWESIKTLTIAAGLESRVILLRNMAHADVLAYMERATIFAFPSRFEPLGIAMLEAGVFGIPVVASRVGGIPEVINSEDVGILVEPDDEERLESALLKLLNDDALRVVLGRGLRKRVSSDFTWSKAWEKYNALLHSQPTPAHDAKPNGVVGCL